MSLNPFSVVVLGVDVVVVLRSCSSHADFDVSFRNSLYSREDASSNHTLGYNSIFLLKSVLQYVPFGNQLDASLEASETFLLFRFPNYLLFGGLKFEIL